MAHAITVRLLCAILWLAECIFTQRSIDSNFKAPTELKGANIAPICVSRQQS